MASSGTWVFMFSTMAFFGFLAFMNTILPPEMQFVNTFDFIFFGGSIIAIAGACVVITGVTCAVALGAFGVLSFFNYIVVDVNWLKLIIFMPIVITMIYILSQLARGTD